MNVEDFGWNDVQAFWSNVRVEGADDCWLWRTNDANRYGSFSLHGQSFIAHRTAYILTKGVIPEGLLIRHTCDCPACCNPNHLVAGTHTQNMRDIYIHGKRSRPPVPKEPPLYINIKVARPTPPQEFLLRLLSPEERIKILIDAALNKLDTKSDFSNEFINSDAFRIEMEKIFRPAQITRKKKK